MLSVVIPTRNDERALVRTLASLVPAAADGVVRDVIVADSGSTDATLEVADLAGCRVAGPVPGGPQARGALLDGAVRTAKGPWVMVLEPGVVLEEGWHREAAAMIETLERRGEAERRALTFSFGLDSFDASARLSERFAGLTRLLTGLPRPEQGLLVHRSLYDRAGGFRNLPAMAGADLLRRIGSRRLLRLRSRALAPVDPDARGAWGKAALRGGLLMLRLPTSVVARLG
ncbi:glycosyltransferase [Chelatococcus sambhunathii]|uniref:Glycosyltransferase n=1 Tax=Chelatococcus sambhunathii TaxID=363953 RepID=A0ABU1DIF0_9HYPH|nr:glycosyltransferase [Chelatococcus sambhunathii]MDR4307851.1 glycosyltransferase [Chelatococcus sambhunathii]